MTGGGLKFRAIVNGKEVDSSNGMLTIPVAAGSNARQTLTYELTVPEGPVSVQRLHEWAVEQADARGAGQAPLTVDWFTPNPSKVVLDKGSISKLPDVRGFLAGRDATAEELGARRTSRRTPRLYRRGRFGPGCITGQDECHDLSRQGATRGAGGGHAGGPARMTGDPADDRRGRTLWNWFPSIVFWQVSRGGGVRLVRP